VGSLEAGAGAEGGETDEDGAPVEEREGVAIACAPHVRAKWFRARELARRKAGEALPVWAAMEAVAAEVASAIPVEETQPDVEPEEGLGGAGAEGSSAGEPPRTDVAWVRPDAAPLDLPVRPRVGSWRARVCAASLGAARPEADACAAQPNPARELEANGCAAQPNPAGTPDANGCAAEPDPERGREANGCTTQPSPAGGLEASACAAQADSAGAPDANGCAAQRHPASALPDLPPEVAALLDGLDACDAFALDARLRRAVALERRFEARAGPLLLAVAESRRHRDRGHARLEDYAREVLGISPRKARALLRLERACRRAPALRRAYREGGLSWVKAQALVPLALLPETPLDHAGAPCARDPLRPALLGWIGWAERVTVRRLEEDVDRALIEHGLHPERGPLPHDAGAVVPGALASEAVGESGAVERQAGAHPTAPAPRDDATETSAAERQTGAQPTAPAPRDDATETSAAERQTGAHTTVSAAEDGGENGSEIARLFWSAPKPAARFFRATLCSVQRWSERTTGWLPTPGEAFEAMLDHALDAWCRSDGGLRREHRIFERDGWRCAVPGCTSYRNLHDHHVEFRSAGGSDDESNRVALCAGHHLRGVHAGRVRIRGRAPGGLRFELGVRPGAPALEVYRSGDMRA
jgi:hypothetical protein